MRFTIFTPTFNRAYIITRLYESLKKQSFKDFEWVVIDDGSCDNTEDLFAKWQKQNNFFSIKYVKVINGGKHRAINKGVLLASGELFYMVDSDDYLPEDALEIIDYYEKTIPKEEKHLYSGVCGNKHLVNKPNVPWRLENDYIDITTLEREKYSIYGDKAEVVYTTVMKKYPFPEFDGELFCTECVVWDKIAFDGYKMRFFYKDVMNCEYMPDGLTYNNRHLYYSSPKSYGLFLHQRILYKKIVGTSKYISIAGYYDDFVKTIGRKEVCNNLHMNYVIFGFFICYCKIVRFLYSTKRELRRFLK